MNNLIMWATDGVPKGRVIPPTWSPKGEYDPKRIMVDVLKLLDFDQQLHKTKCMTHWIMTLDRHIDAGSMLAVALEAYLYLDPGSTAHLKSFEPFGMWQQLLDNPDDEEDWTERVVEYIVVTNPDM